MSKERPEPKTALGRFLRQLQKKNIFLSLLIDFVSVVGAALILSLLIKTFLLRSFFIPSGSMLETLQINDRIFVNELVPNVIAVERGDVVVFKDPGGWLGAAPADTDKPVILPAVQQLVSLGFTIIATGGTQRYLAEAGVPVEPVNKVAEGRPHIVDRIIDGEVALIFNTTEGWQSLKDSQSIRGSALTGKVPYFTTAAASVAAAEAIAALRGAKLEVRSLQDYYA